jgi:hypothetical protein
MEAFCKKYQNVKSSIASYSTVTRGEEAGTQG